MLTQGDLVRLMPNVNVNGSIGCLCGCRSGGSSIPTFNIPSFSCGSFGESPLFRINFGGNPVVYGSSVGLSAGMGIPNYMNGTFTPFNKTMCLPQMVPNFGFPQISPMLQMQYMPQAAQQQAAQAQMDRAINDLAGLLVIGMLANMADRQPNTKNVISDNKQPTILRIDDNGNLTEIDGNKGQKLDIDSDDLLKDIQKELNEENQKNNGISGNGSLKKAQNNQPRTGNEQQIKQPSLDNKDLQKFKDKLLNKLDYRTSTGWSLGTTRNQKKETHIKESLETLSDKDFLTLFTDETLLKDLSQKIYQGRNKYIVGNYILERLSSLAPEGKKLMLYDRIWPRSNTLKLQSRVDSRFQDGYKLIDLDNPIGDAKIDQNEFEKAYNRMAKVFNNDRK